MPPTTMVGLLGLACFVPELAAMPVPPPRDARQDPPRDLHTPVPPPNWGSKAAWLQRRRELRDQVACAAGLLPMPARPPLEPHISGRLVRDGYTIEKVWFETAPGLVLGGNLYRPLGHTGRRPAVLTPHGHMTRGRLHHDDTFSVPARCVALARQGYVVFSYDMIGYNDTGLGLSHQSFGTTDPTAALWGLSLFGLQSWNSLRALDFLVSLPEVDSKRVGVTGESGGGTQTFILTAIDDRVAAAAPINMISLHMQGGCLCENAPGLRIDTNNVEIGALAAPRPMLMVSATGDWTVHTPELEGPATRRIYDLYGAGDRLEWVQMDAGHNSNLASRQAVYAFFGKWLLPDRGASDFAERPFETEPDAALRVFEDDRPPAEQVDEATLTARWITECRRQWTEALPTDAAGLARFRALYQPALRWCLHIDPVPQSAVRGLVSGDEAVIGRSGAGDRVVGRWFGGGPAAALVLADDDEVAIALASRGRTVLRLRPFRYDPPRDARAAFFTCYNHTELANRVQDVLTGLAWLRRRGHRDIALVGCDRVGLAALLARPFAAGVGAAAVDLCGLDLRSDATYTDDLRQPGLRRAGDFVTAALLAAPGPLLLHQASGFDAGPPKKLYRALGGRLSVTETACSPKEMLAWLDGH